MITEESGVILLSEALHGSCLEVQDFGNAL